MQVKIAIIREAEITTSSNSSLGLETLGAK